MELFKLPLLNDAGLTHYYRFEGNSNDSKGANNGSDANMSYGAGYGKFGSQGASFNGSNSLITCAQNITFQISRAINLWLNISTMDRPIMSSALSLANGNPLFILRTDATKLKLYHGDGTYHAGVTTISTGVWNMVTINYTQATGAIAMYLNATIQDYAATLADNATWPNDDNFYIGSGYDGTTFFHGLMDDISIFNRALTLDERVALFKAGGHHLPLLGVGRA